MEERGDGKQHFPSPYGGGLHRKAFIYAFNFKKELIDVPNDLCYCMF